ncbi:MAG: aminotransferase class IV [Ferruginibacter sp.]
MDYFIFNGKFYPENTAVVNAGNRGLRFGDGLFETLRANQGEIEFLDEHLARLWQGLAVLQFQIPKHFSPDKLQEDIGNLLRKNGHVNLARIRLTLFRGDGGLYDDINHTPGYLIQSWALPNDSGKWNSNGLVLGIYEEAKKSCDLLSNLKHNNFLPYVLAALQAKKQKWNDALLLNTNGNICDTSIANIFLIKDELIYTPALTEGCIAGIMRKQVINHLNQLPVNVIETTLSIDDLVAADEVFLTNSIYHIRWVQAVGDKKYGNQQTQKIYSTLFSTKN